MGRRAKHWLQIALDSGLPGLALIVVGCIFVTLATARSIDSDEVLVSLVVACLGTMVGTYRVFRTNQKQRSNGNG